MHGKIYHLSAKPHKRHVSYDEIVEVLSDGFIGYVADYVGKSEREEDIAELVDYLAEKAPDCFEYDLAENSITFKAGFKQKYFRQKFEEFKRKAAAIELKDFAEDTYKTYELMQLLDDRHSYYVYMNGYWETFDSFVRGTMEEGKKYFIGATFDYHW